MALFTRNSGELRLFSCVSLCLMLLCEISVRAAEPSGDPERTFPEENSYFPSLGLPAALPESPEITDYCLVLLREFGQRYSSLATCLVSNARPVKVCRECSSGYKSFRDVYANISDEVRVLKTSTV